ncbi:MAG: hypothetical protein EP344_18280, partial [Bacteroidetes bacterium]
MNPFNIQYIIQAVSKRCHKVPQPLWVLYIGSISFFPGTAYAGEVSPVTPLHPSDPTHQKNSYKTAYQLTYQNTQSYFIPGTTDLLIKNHPESPAACPVSITGTTVICEGESTTLEATGSAFTAYLWSTGEETASITVVPSVTTTYSVTVTCPDATTATASVTVTVHSTPALSTTTVSPLCNGGNDGSIDLTVTGGTPNYFYGWSNGNPNEDPTGLVAGTYTVLVTDANNCTATTSATITEPTAINPSASITAVTCNGGNNGAVDLTVTGGTPPYSFAWPGGITTEDISGLTAGTYTVTVTDDHDCTATFPATVTEPAALSFSTSITPVSCISGNNGAIDLTVSGGTSPYTYEWSNNETTEDIGSLNAGTYIVTVTDANSCTGTTSAIVTEPTALDLSTTV